MRARLARTLFVGSWLWMLGLGCGGGKPAELESGQSQMKCTPGTVYSCVRWNCSGHQRCADDGKMLEACMCDSDAADGGGSGAGGVGSGAGGQRSTPVSGSVAKANSANGGAAANAPASQQADAGAVGDAGDAQRDADAMHSAMPNTVDAGASGAPKKPAQDAGKPSQPSKPDMPMMPDTQTLPPSKPEQCDNGLDDDGDGKPDCADPDCTMQRCVAAAPSGWQGPVALQVATAAAGVATPAVACSGLFDQRAFEAGAEAQGAPAQCSACTCQGSCGTFVDFSVSAGAQCSAASACTTSVNGSCVEIAPQCLQMATLASLETKLPNAGTCTSSEQHATLSSPSWKAQVAGCGLRAAGSGAGGCRAEQLCLPQSPLTALGAAFGADYCVWREGEAECPASTYTQRSVYYRELADTRGCSACGCAATSCKYSWRVFNADDAMCASPVLELSSAGQCAQVNPVMGKLRVGGAVSGDGSCTASGGESRGGVAGSKPLTVCCGR